MKRVGLLVMFLGLAMFVFELCHAPSNALVTPGCELRLLGGVVFTSVGFGILLFSGRWRTT